MTVQEMYELAVSKLNPTETDMISYGMVAAVLESESGKIYTGVNVDLACGLGYCAERNAAGTMLTACKRVVRRIVCVNKRGELMTPCGSCREFLFQLSPENRNAGFLVQLSPVQFKTLNEFLPDWWNREKVKE